MKVYMKTTKDKYELPIAVADSAKELAYLLGMSVGSIYSSISKKIPGYIRVDIGDDEADND